MKTTETKIIEKYSQEKVAMTMFDKLIELKNNQQLISTDFFKEYFNELKKWIISDEDYFNEMKKILLEEIKINKEKIKKSEDKNYRPYLFEHYVDKYTKALLENDVVKGYQLPIDFFDKKDQFDASLIKQKIQSINDIFHLKTINNLEKEKNKHENIKDYLYDMIKKPDFISENNQINELIWNHFAVHSGYYRSTIHKNIIDHLKEEQFIDSVSLSWLKQEEVVNFTLELFSKKHYNTLHYLIDLADNGNDEEQKNLLHAFKNFNLNNLNHYRDTHDMNDAVKILEHLHTFTQKNLPKDVCMLNTISSDVKNWEEIISSQNMNVLVKFFIENNYDWEGRKIKKESINEEILTWAILYNNADYTNQANKIINKKAQAETIIESIDEIIKENHQQIMNNYLTKGYDFKKNVYEFACKNNLNIKQLEIQYYDDELIKDFKNNLKNNCLDIYFHKESILSVKTILTDFFMVQSIQSFKENHPELEKNKNMEKNYLVKTNNHQIIQKLKNENILTDEIMDILLKGVFKKENRIENQYKALEDLTQYVQSFFIADKKVLYPLIEEHLINLMVTDNTPKKLVKI